MNAAESAALLAAFFTGAAFVLLVPSRPKPSAPERPQPGPGETPVIGPPPGWSR